jgi:hypothetical protein
MGAVETLEPPLVSSLVGSTMLLRGMGSLTCRDPLSCSRAPSRDTRRREKQSRNNGRRARRYPGSGMDFPAARSDCVDWQGRGRAAAAVLKRRRFFRIDWQRFNRGVYAR